MKYLAAIGMSATVAFFIPPAANAEVANGGQPYKVSASKARPVKTLTAAMPQAEIDKMAADLVSVAQRLSTFIVSSNTADGDIGTIKQQLTSLQQTVTTTQASLAALTTRVDNLGSSNPDQAAKIRALEAAVAALTTRVDALIASGGDLAAKVAALQASVAALTVRVAALEKPTPPPEATLSFSGPATATVAVPFPLQWNSNLEKCDASGGWTGSFAASGNQNVTISSVGNVTYTLTCSAIDGRSIAKSVSVAASQPPASEMGPLTVSPSNPNYFARPDGTPVLLVGSHTWNNLLDQVPPAAFDYPAYLSWMKKNDFNFIRMWTEEVPQQTFSNQTRYVSPLPFSRTNGSLGNAADGKPKFDLNTLNQEYFDRLRARVIAAGQNGIYVSVMLFEGWSLLSNATTQVNPWTYHPFNKNNNINGVDGDPQNTGKGLTIQTTSASAAVLAAQQAYVRKVIDTVGDLDNVLYEISNESHTSSTQWQYNMINYIKNYEAGKPKQHPVGMTMNDYDNATVFNSPADWVSPSSYGYKENPPAGDGKKVVIDDTDHIFGIGGDVNWVWQAFTRGLNVTWMDDMADTGIAGAMLSTPPYDPWVYTARNGMTQVEKYAKKMDLKKAKPHGELSSSGYALADPGNQYLVFCWGCRNFTVDLSAGAGSKFSIEWQDQYGIVYPGNEVDGGKVQSFTAPFVAPSSSVLFLKKTSNEPPPITPDGTVLEGGHTGTLVTSLGTWSFGNEVLPGLWQLLLNGADTGGASKAEVAKGGQLYAIGSDGRWYTVQGWANWTPASDPNTPPPTTTPDGTVLEGGKTGTLITPLGEWRFGNEVQTGLWQLLLNGKDVGGASKIEVAHGGKLYAVDGTGQWYIVYGLGNWTPTSDPNAPPPTTDATNKIALTNKSGAVVANYPYQFGHPFVEGEIPHSPEVLQDGKPGSSQCDVKNRWPDGSVKYAVCATVVTSLPATGDVTLTFQDQATPNNTPLTNTQMLDASYNFDAVIQLTDPASGKVVKASARQMLQDGNCKPWTSGPIAQTMTCADDSAARKYDMSFTDNRGLRPRFNVTFWPATKNVSVRYIGEVTNSEGLEEFVYNLSLTAGQNNPTETYKQDNVRQSIATRWTRSRWIGNVPEQRVNIKQNVGYLVKTGIIPPYDPSVQVPEAAVADQWEAWHNKDISINGPGFWYQSTPDPGDRPDLAPNPTWFTLALQSGDWRALNVAYGMADLAGAWQMHIRENNPNKKMDKAQTVSGMGRPVSLYARMSSWFLDWRAPGDPGDAFVITFSNDKDWNGWSSVDWAHAPEPFAIVYVLSGDPFYLEQEQFWGMNNAFKAPPGNGSYNRGPGARIYDQARGQAWGLRTRVNAWALTPDDDPLKGVIHDNILDGLAGLMGERDVHGMLDNHPMYAYTASFGWPPYFRERPLHWWEPGPGYTLSNTWAYDTNVAAGGVGGWQQYWNIIETGQAVRLGIPEARALFEWAASNLIWQLTDPNYSPYLAAQYTSPMTKWITDASGNKTEAFITTPADTLLAWAPHYRAWHGAAFFPHLHYVRSAVAQIVDLMGRKDLWPIVTGIYDELAQGMPQYQDVPALPRQDPNWGYDPRYGMKPVSMQ